LSLVGRDDIITLRKIEHFIGRKVQVSAFEGLEAEFKPVERRPRDGKPGGSFRKPGYGPGHGTGYANGAGKKPWSKDRAAHGTGDRPAYGAGDRPAHGAGSRPAHGAAGRSAGAGSPRRNSPGTFR